MTATLIFSALFLALSGVLIARLPLEQLPGALRAYWRTARAGIGRRQRGSRWCGTTGHDQRNPDDHIATKSAMHLEHAHPYQPLRLVI